MTFVNHLFISYAQIDNEQTEENDHGWVDQFHRSLRAYFSWSIGEEAQIWRDPKLHVHETESMTVTVQFTMQWI
jgi:hypothetical protein